LDDVSYFVQKKRHPHKIKQEEESFPYLEDTPIEKRCQNSPDQKLEPLGVQWTFQA
jgi:hypothetical protein